MSCNWPKVRLGDVCKIRRGSSPRPIVQFMSESGMPWVKIADATETNSRFIEKTNEFIKHEGVSKSVIVNEGDLILSNSGTAGLPKFMKITACIHDGWQTLSDFDGIDKYFLYYSLLNIRSNLLRNAHDSTMKNLTLDMVRDAEISLPTISEQKSIATVLSDIDSKFELNIAINQNLEEMAQAIFKSWFVDFDPVKAKMNGEQPEGMDAATASLFPEKLVESELGLIPEGWEAVQIGNIVERLKPKKRYTKKQVEPYGKTPVYEQGASILLGFHNDDAGFDASPEEPVFIFGDHTCITHLSCSKFDISSNVIPLKGSIRPTIWTYYAIQGKQEFQEYRRHWSEFIIKGVVLPPIELAEKYAELVTTNYLMMESLKRQSKELEQLRDTLLPKLLSGEIDLKESGAVEENDVVSRLLQQMDFGIKSKPRKGPIPNGSIGYITMSGTFGSDGGTFVDIPKAVQALTKITSADGTYGEIAGNALTESVLSGTVEIVTNNIIPLGVLTKICTAVFGKKTPIKPRDAVLLTSIHQAKNKTLDGIMNEQAKRFKFLEQSSMDEQEFGESLRYLESIGVVKCEGQHIALLDTIVQH